MQIRDFVTSSANPLLKEVRKAVGRSGLTASGLCLAEGAHLVEEALRSGVEVRALLVSESAEGMAARFIEQADSARVVILPDTAFAAIATTDTPQGLTALAVPRAWKAEDLFRAQPLVVVLDGIQDPGNAGAIVRAAEAFGATGVIFAKGTVSPYNPRTLRGSAGSLFRIPYITGVETGEIPALSRTHGCSLRTAMPWGPGVEAADQADLTRASVIVVGNEGRGVGDVLREAGTAIGIRTSAVESLNASVAAAILLYEASRQRSR